VLAIARNFLYRTILSYVNLRTLSSEILCFAIVCGWSYVFFILPITLEDESSALYRNFGQQTPSDGAKYPKRTKFWNTPLRESEKSYIRSYRCINWVV